MENQGSKFDRNSLQHYHGCCHFRYLHKQRHLSTKGGSGIRIRDPTTNYQQEKMARNARLLAVCVALALAACAVAQAPCRTQSCFEEKLPLLHDKLNEIFGMPKPPKPASSEGVDAAADARRKGGGGGRGGESPLLSLSLSLAS
jgi:hypothetical protein